MSKLSDLERAVGLALAGQFPAVCDVLDLDLLAAEFTMPTVVDVQRL